MREILFRAKRLPYYEWIQGYYFQKSSESGEMYHLMLATDGYMYDVDPDTVSEYTGLLDSNGVKIFEGDILKTDSGPYAYCKAVVEYGTGDFSCGCHYYHGWVFRDLEPDEDNRMNYNDSRYVSEYEVIGNRYDNPDLLNGGE